MSDSLPRGIRLLAVSLLALLAASSFAFYLGRDYLEVEELPVGDVAADMLLERVIDDQGYLLTGHYSRFEFNHPGPFFFYAHHLVHVVLDPYGWPASSSAYASTMILNVAFLLVGVFLAHKTVGLSPGFWSLLCGVLIVFSVLGHGIHGLWMPSKIVMPFFAYFFCLVLLSRRELQYAPLACLLVSVLIHGYVSMIALALPMLFLATGWGLLRKGRALTAREIGYLAGGAATGLLFVAPMALDCLLNEQCNPGRIIQFAMAAKPPPPGWIEILRSADSNFFIGFGVIQFVLFLGGAYCFHAGEELRAIWRSCLAIALSMTVAFVVYHRFVPGPMHVNMVLFMRAVPMALVTLCTVCAFRFVADAEWKSRLPRHALRIALVGLALLGVLHLRPQGLRPDAGRHIRHLARGISSVTEGSAQARIDYLDHEQWPTIAGVMLELERDRISCCTTRRNMAFLFTENRVCGPTDVANVTLVPAARCEDRCVLRVRGTGIVPGPIRALPGQN